MALFIGRQPILDHHTVTFGYELLFRNGIKNTFEELDGDAATSSVIDSGFLSLEFDAVTNGKKAFVNFTTATLKEEYWRLLPRDKVVIEVLETVEPDQEVIESCQALKAAGYTLALDDFEYAPAWDPLVDIADIIKVDLGTASMEQAEAYAKRYLPRNIRLLAEFIETLSDFKRTKEMGYSLFQGYFFAKPEVLESEQISTSKLAKLQLMEKVNKPEIDYGELNDILKGDPALTVKLLKYVNSAALGVRYEVRAIRQALALIGAQNLRKWISILLMSTFSEDLPRELTRQAITRGRFCELMAEEAGLAPQSTELFLTGIFSLMDAVFKRSMETLLPDLPLSDDVKNTLLGEATDYKPLLDLVRALENGSWKTVESFSAETGIAGQPIAQAFQESIAWTERFMLV